jgi:formylmethanofuran dehydrogenase subunit B
MMVERRIEHVTCLGCGCSCDDVTITVRENRIVDAAPVCPVGKAWLGDGQVPARILSQGRPVTLEQALSDAAAVLTRHSPCLIYLAPDLTSQAQRTAVAVADLLKAGVDCATSSTAATGLLTTQRRGRAGATLGEIRNRGDVFLFWGVNPTRRYPRFLERYALEPAGTHVPQGRRGRQVISVSIGEDQSLEDADLTFTIEPQNEIATLSLMRAAVLGHEFSGSVNGAGLAREVASRLIRARYAVIVHDSEPTPEQRNPLRVEALVGLTQALNAPTRAALCSLRAGGNQVGAESVMTWQTGYPFAVDFRRGFPRFDPGGRGMMLLSRQAYRSALIAGSPQLDDLPESLSQINPVVIGPRASEVSFKTQVAVDTGVGGIHDSGTAYRMDEVPLRLRPVLNHPRSAAEVLAGLHRALRNRPA